MPFFNGLGCNFTFLSDNHVSFQQGTCKSGILNVYIKNKDDSTVLLKRMRWGYFGDFIYTYPLLTDTLTNRGNGDEQGRYTTLYKNTDLTIGRIVKISNGRTEYATLFDHPIDVIYISKIRGRMGFYVANN